MVTIYTDGASRGNPGPGGWGAIIILDDNSQFSISNFQKNKEWVTEIGGRENHTTNNKMELTAAIRSLEFTISNSQFSNQPVQIYTDSEYVMKGMMEWIHKWQKKGWKTANRKPVLNQDLWQALLRAADGKKVEWKYVAGHSGDRFNDRCDDIATSFADNIMPVLYDGPREKYK